MSKLLLATDHCFDSCDNKIYDRYGFGLNFFADYLSVFDEVHVLARVNKVVELSPNSIRSNSERIIFHALPQLSGLIWMLKSKRLINKKLNHILKEVDCIICRVPSQTGYWAAKQAIWRKVPYMIEVIGDPKAAVSGISNYNLIFKFIAQQESNKLKEIAAHANVASYVNKLILPFLYPAPKATIQDSISSIRLPESDIVKSKKSFPSQPVKFIKIASLVPIKRHQDILHCAKILKQANLDFEIHLVGGGKLQRSLEELAQKLGVQENIIFHGHISSREEINTLLEASTMFIFSSSSEGLPRSVMEAMAKGLPIISTDVGGIPELVHQKYLVKKMDYQGMAHKILQVLNDPHELKTMAEDNLKKVQNYSQKVLFTKRNKLYKHLLNLSKP